MSKITDGLIDRRKDALIAPSGPGLTDDSSQPIEATDEEVIVSAPSSETMSARR